MSVRARHLPSVLLACAAALGLLAGCEDELPKATLIERMRVLGVRLEVEGDEARATPRPGERVGLSFAVVFPELEQDVDDLQMLLIGCTAPSRYTGGLPICQEFIDAAAAGEDPSVALPMLEGQTLSCADLGGLSFESGALSLRCVQGAPRTRLAVPDRFAADGLLFRGVICERGTPYVDPEDPTLFGCEDGGEAIRVHGTVPVEREGGNRNPDLAPLELLREGVPWPAYDADELPPERGCETVLPQDFSEPVHLIAPGKHLITIRYDTVRDGERTRETFEGEPENLEITIYATLGEMERRFTVFQGSDEGPLESDLEWEPPPVSELPRGGQLVRFFVTLRDQRGGFAMTERAVCVQGGAAR